MSSGEPAPVRAAEAPVGVMLSGLDNRYGREQLDVALALISMDVPVQLLLVDSATAALQAAQLHADAELAGEYRWSKLLHAAMELGVELLVSSQHPETASQATQAVRYLTPEEMARAMAQCGHLIHV